MSPVTIYQRPLTPASSESVSGMSDVGTVDEFPGRQALSIALHVIRTERDALTALEELYESNGVAQEGFDKAVSAICTSIGRGGKLVVSGVGKSGHIGRKVNSTMNSLGIRSAFLHPTEALHGDLGMIVENDIMIIISYSGRTQELCALLPHLPANLTLIVVTSHVSPSTCALFEGRLDHLSILLPAPVPTVESESFGVAAPTTSTTVALALTDALAIAVAHRLHQDPSAVFQSYHPGGALGAMHQMRSQPIVTSRSACGLAQDIED